MLSTTIQFFRRSSTNGTARKELSFGASTWAPLVAALIVGYFSFRVAWLNDFMVHVDDIVALAEAIRQGVNPLSFAEVTKLSTYYTYPPGQFYFSLPLAFLGTDYATTLLLYRLPSLALWLAGVLVLWKVIRALWPDQPRSHAAAVILLPLVSWRGFIESSQGYPYASTLLISATLAWFIVTPQGRDWLTRGPISAYLIGVLFGFFSWFTYQAVFITAAALGSYFMDALCQRQWRRLSLSILTGVGFAGPFGWVAWNCLRHVLSFASGTPGWAMGVPGNSPFEKLSFPFRGWFEAVQANLTFLPWGSGSAIIAAIAVGVILVGLVHTLTRRESLLRHRPLLWFLAAVAVVFTAGPFLKQFPLGPTRHTFVLQGPILLAVALGLAACRFSKAIYVTTCGVVAAVALWFMPTLLKNTTNRVDFNLIEHYFNSDPQARMVDLPGAFTWDFTYLGRGGEKERIRWNNQFANVNELAAFLAKAPRGYLVSHRSPMNEDTRAALRAAGFMQITTLAAIAPKGSTELSRDLNGGNGFFFYAVAR